MDSLCTHHLVPKMHSAGGKRVATSPQHLSCPCGAWSKRRTPDASNNTQGPLQAATSVRAHVPNEERFRGFKHSTRKFAFVRYIGPRKANALLGCFACPVQSTVARACAHVNSGSSEHAVRSVCHTQSPHLQCKHSKGPLTVLHKLVILHEPCGTT